MQIAVEATVNAPPDVVFQTTADIANWPKFISGIQAVELLTPGPVAAGMRFRETRTMFGKAATEEMTVAEFEPPRRFLLTAFNHGTAYRAEHTFAAEGAGTRLRLAFEGRPVALAARLFIPLGWLFASSVRRQLEGDLADLKAEAEAERRHREGGADTT
jgi:carbon monoxide dehydrogenase subunit G